MAPGPRHHDAMRRGTSATVGCCSIVVKSSRDDPGWVMEPSRVGKGGGMIRSERDSNTRMRPAHAPAYIRSIVPNGTSFTPCSGTIQSTGTPGSFSGIGP
jgi:hypothetical protein